MGFSKFIAIAFIAVELVLSCAAKESRAQYRGRRGGSAFIRGSSGLPPVGRRPRPRATVVPNRSGGFDMFSPRGDSRYLGKPQGNQVFHPDGTTSVVIPDHTGGSTVYGPQGTHRVFTAEDRYTDE